MVTDHAPASRASSLPLFGLVLAVVLAPVRLVVSVMALRRTSRVGPGRGLATAGVVIGAGQTLVLLLFAVGTSAYSMVGTA